MAGGCAKRLCSLSLLACICASSGKHVPKRHMEQPIVVTDESGKPAMKECEKTLTLHSNTCQAQSELGTYEMRFQIPGGRPIYQKVGSKSLSPYLFYYENFSNWRIGYDYSNVDAVLTSSTTKSFRCPRDVNAWYQVGDADGPVWERVRDIVVDDASDDNPLDNPDNKTLDTAVATAAVATDDNPLDYPSVFEEHRYEEMGVGVCQDDDHRHTNYYYAKAHNVNAGLCETHCNADANCIAYNAYVGRMCVLWMPIDQPDLLTEHWTFVEGTGATDITRKLYPITSGHSAVDNGPLADFQERPTNCMRKVAKETGFRWYSLLGLVLLPLFIIVFVGFMMCQKRKDKQAPSDNGADDDGTGPPAFPKEPLEADGDEGDETVEMMETVEIVEAQEK